MMSSRFVRFMGICYSVISMSLWIMHVQLVGNMDTNNMIQSDVKSIHQHVVKYVLDNGLTVLVHEAHQVPQVSFQIFYNVGSKDELLGEKGIAHLIEHMIFKGTDTLSESDINIVVHKQ